MEEQQISYLTSLMALNRGFTHFDETKLVKDGDRLFLSCNQSLLQKWIREVHDLHISVDKKENGKYNFDFKYKEENDDYFSYPELNPNYEFEKYEDALEKALEYTLWSIPKTK